MTNDIGSALQSIEGHVKQMDVRCARLTVENAGMLRVLDLAAQLVAGTPRPDLIAELALAVKECNAAPITRKAILDIEAVGMEKMTGQLEQVLAEGISKQYQQGANYCIGIGRSLVRRHRSTQ